LETVPRENRPSLWAPVAASLAVHLFAIGFAPAFGVWNDTTSPAREGEREKVLRVRFPSPDRPSTSRILDPRGELVDIIDSQKSEAKAPSGARFLSDKNRTVEKETQARFTGPNPTTAFGKPGSSRQAFRKTPSSLSKTGVVGTGKVKLEVPESIMGEGPGPSSSSRVASLAPSNYLPEVAIGDQTLLSTREYAYASFYIRMKRQMEATWDPRSVINAERLARDQYVTTLAITLKPDGSLDDVRIEQSSGNPRLDQQAVEAVHQAAPYLNPPPQLVDEDSRIHIPVWNFIVTLHALF
jgi:TonB family protein